MIEYSVQMSFLSKLCIVVIAVICCTLLSSYLAFTAIDVPFGFGSAFGIFSLWDFYGQSLKYRLTIVVCTMIPLLLVCAISYVIFNKREALHGEAVFASKTHYRKTLLKHKTGIILGRIGGSYLIAGGTEHTALIAPTRSGKGVGVVIPNLLSWIGSAIVTDMKFENFMITGNYRKSRGQGVYLFAPGEINSHCWNVFDLVDSHDPNRIDKLMRISLYICPTPETQDPMWSTEGRNIFIAIAVYLQDIDQHLSFYSVLNYLQVASEDDLLLVLANDTTLALDPIVHSNFKSYAQMGSKQRAGVKSTLTTSLSIFSNPLIASATNHSDFDIRELKRKPITIYLGTKPSSMDMLAPLFNLFYQFFISVNTETLPTSDDKYQVLLLMDEFAQLGRLDLIKKGIAYFAGYNIRLLVVIQGLAQLESIYTASGMREFIVNFAYRIYYAPNDNKDAENLSNELGTKTVINRSRSRSTMLANRTNATDSTSDTSRKLMLAQEIKLLPKSKALILTEGAPPILAHKLVYYKDRSLKGRFYNIVSPELTPSMAPPVIPEVPYLDRSLVLNHSYTEHIDTSDGGVDSSSNLSSNSKEVNVYSSHEDTPTNKMSAVQLNAMVNKFFDSEYNIED